MVLCRRGAQKAGGPGFPRPRAAWLSCGQVRSRAGRHVDDRRDGRRADERRHSLRRLDGLRAGHRRAAAGQATDGEPEVDGQDGVGQLEQLGRDGVAQGREAHDQAEHQDAGRQQELDGLEHALVVGPQSLQQFLHETGTSLSVRTSLCSSGDRARSGRRIDVEAGPGRDQGPGPARPA